MTAPLLADNRRQHRNNSCWWSFEPTPYSTSNSSFLLPPTVFFLLLLVSSSQVLKSQGRGQSKFQFVTAAPNSIRCQESWPTMTEAGRGICLANHFLLANRGSKREAREKGGRIFCVAFSPILLWLWSMSESGCWLKRVISTFMRHIWRGCWGPTQACFKGWWSSKRFCGLVVSRPCSWAVTCP